MLNHTILVLWEDLKEIFGHLFNFFDIPGFVRKMKIYDDLTDTYIEVRLNVFFAVISVNGKDYYFKRLIGKYDGSGMCLKCAN